MIITSYGFHLHTVSSSPDHQKANWHQCLPATHADTGSMIYSRLSLPDAPPGCRWLMFCFMEPNCVVKPLSGSDKWLGNDCHSLIELLLLGLFSVRAGNVKFDARAVSVIVYILKKKKKKSKGRGLASFNINTFFSFLESNRTQSVHCITRILLHIPISSIIKCQCNMSKCSPLP